MEPIDPTEKLEYWREHVRKVALFEGAQTEYARQNEISAAKLSYYKGQFAPKPGFAKVAAKASATMAAPPQFKTAICDDSTSKVKVDAKWLATFLKEFLR